MSVEYKTKNHLLDELKKLKRHGDELAVLNAFIHKIITSLSLDQVVKSALEGISSLFAPDIAIFYTREDNALLLKGVYPESKSIIFEQKAVHRLGECLCGLAASHGKSFYSNDIQRDPRCTWDECKKAGLRSFAAIPLRINETTIGVLGIASFGERNFEERDVFLSTLAGEIAIGLQNATLYQHVQNTVTKLEQEIMERKKAEEALLRSQTQLKSLSSQLLEVQEQERKRVAQELHDSVGQTLVALKYRVETLLNQRDTHLGQAASLNLETLIPKIQDALEEVEKIGKGLRPSILDDLGIIATISWFCREFQAVYSSITVTRIISLKEPEIPDPIKLTMYRILQESCNNIAKHSQADHIIISLTKTPKGIEFCIKDNGKGFDVSSTLSSKSSHVNLGLIGMITRAELTGGSCEISSQKGKGTTIRILWPF